MSDSEKECTVSISRPAGENSNNKEEDTENNETKDESLASSPVTLSQGEKPEITSPCSVKLHAQITTDPLEILRKLEVIKEIK